MRLGLILCAFGWHRWQDYGDGSGDGCSRRCDASRAWYERPEWRGRSEADKDEYVAAYNRQFEPVGYRERVYDEPPRWLP